MISENTATSCEQRVLLVPSTNRDADAITKVLKSVLVDCEVCASISALCDALTAGAGAVLTPSARIRPKRERIAEGAVDDVAARETLAGKAVGRECQSCVGAPHVGRARIHAIH